MTIYKVQGYKHAQYLEYTDALYAANGDLSRISEAKVISGKMKSNETISDEETEGDI